MERELTINDVINFLENPTPTSSPPTSSPTTSSTLPFTYPQLPPIEESLSNPEQTNPSSHYPKTATPFRSQKSHIKLHYLRRTYTKKSQQKTKRTWRCTDRSCNGVIRTALNSYEVLHTSEHKESCNPLTDAELDQLVSMLQILDDTSNCSTRELIPSNKYQNVLHSE